MTNVTDAAAGKVASDAADHPKIPALVISILAIVSMVVAIGTIVWMHITNVKADEENAQQWKDREKQHGRTRRLLQQQDRAEMALIKKQDDQEKALMKKQDDEEKELIAKGLATIAKKIDARAAPAALML